MTGNQSMTTLKDTISVSGPATTFMTQHGGGAGCNTNFPATVRFFFRSPSASGPGDPPPGQPVNGLPPAGFYTQFWWSNPEHVELLNGSQASMMMAANMANPAEWSDWDGKSATDPLVTAAFIKATQNVQAIGLSFGGTCFFETGVTAVYPGTPPPYEIFSSQFSEMH